MESITTNENKPLMETIKSGFSVCYEDYTDGIEWNTEEDYDTTDYTNAFTDLGDGLIGIKSNPELNINIKSGLSMIKLLNKIDAQYDESLKYVSGDMSNGYALLYDVKRDLENLYDDYFKVIKGGASNYKKYNKITYIGEVIPKYIPYITKIKKQAAYKK